MGVQKSNRMRAWTIVALAFVLTACATSPTGRRQLMLVSEQEAIAASKQAYTETLKPLAEAGKVNNDPALKARVVAITGRLVAQAILMRPRTAEWEWKVQVIDDPKTVNAWCMAGGRMAVYTGLLRRLQLSDDELAQVMGHEIAHALANHQAEQMSIALATSVGVAAVGAASKQSSVALTGAALAAALAIKLPNSRHAESEADRIGVELAAKSGYDPRAAVSLWDKMGRLSQDRAPEFLSTHPGPEQRRKKLEALVPQMMPYYTARVSRPAHAL